VGVLALALRVVVVETELAETVTPIAPDVLGESLLSPP